MHDDLTQGPFSMSSMSALDRMFLCAQSSEYSYLTLALNAGVLNAILHS